MLEFLKNLLYSIWGNSEVHEDPVVSPKSEYPPLKPTNFVQVLSPNYTKPVHPRQIQYIIIHATVGDRDSSINWLKNPASQVSIHYLIDKAGGVIQMVDENDVSWHAGESEWKGDKYINTHSVGIELVNKNDGIDSYPTIQLSVLMSMCLEIGKRYRISSENILRHCDIAPNRKTDPGPAFPFEKFRKEYELCQLPN